MNAGKEFAASSRDDGLTLDSLQSSSEKVWVSADGLIARLWRVDVDSTRAKIEALLLENGVSEGIDWKVIDSALARAEQGQIEHGLVVARGVPPQKIVDGRVVYHPGLEEERAYSSGLQAYLYGEDLNECISVEGEVIAVGKDVAIAEWMRGRSQAGLTVRGEAFHRVMEDSTPLRPGRGVGVSEDGKKCFSLHYGYAILTGQNLQVLPPIWVAPDQSEVHYVHLPHKFVEPPPSEEDLLGILQMVGIEQGIDSQAIREVCGRIASDNKTRFTRCIARTSLAEERGEAEIRHRFDPQRSLSWDQVQALLNSEDLMDMRAALEWLLADDGLCCTLAKPKDVLAEKAELPEGAENQPFWEIGEQVEADPDGMCVRAREWGYVTLRGGRIEVTSPLWVAPDASAVYFVNLPQRDSLTYPSVEDMAGLLLQSGVIHGFRERDWSDSRRALEAGQKMPSLIPVALATPPQDSVEASFQWAVDMEDNRVGKILEDGSIDFRERSQAPSVTEGDLIGSFTPAARGESGRDVLGREIVPPRSQAFEVTCGQHTREEVRGDKTFFYASMSGEVIPEDRMVSAGPRMRRRLRLNVSQVVNVDGDVGYNTGNIDFNGDVVIRGSVQSLFSVRAEGSIHISGYIEDGAIVSSGRDVMVGGGILGSSTKVDVEGALWAKFAQEADIRVGGDARIGSYLFNASLRAGGKVIVLGRGDGKARSLVGGLVWAGLGIESSSIGSPYNSATRLVSGVDFRQVERMEKLRSMHRVCEERMYEHMEELDMPTLDLDLVRQRLQQRISPKSRSEIASKIKRLVRLNNRRQSLMQEIEDVATAQRMLARSSRIAVRGTMFSGVDVRIGEKSVSFNEERSFREIRLVEEEGEWRIVERPLQVRGGREVDPPTAPA